MKILHIYRCYYPDQFGGLQEAIRQIALTTQPYGVVSRIFTLSPRPSPTVIDTEEAKIFRSRSWMAPMSCDLGGFDAYTQYKSLVEWADIIHYHFPWPFADLMHIALKPQKPALITYHSDIVGKGLAAELCKPLTMRMLKGMDRIIATSPQYRETSPILSHSALASKVQVIPLGINESDYDKTADFSAFETSTFQADKPYVLFIGVFRRYKGLMDLLAAAKWVKGQIVLLGTGLLDKELRTEAKRLGINNVVFLGSQPHAAKVAFLQKATAVVLPSHLRSEAFGTVLVEGLMFGKPLVSCEIGTGTSFVNAHNETGLVVPANQPRQLADAINRLFEDTLLAAEFGRAARKRYETYFAGSKMAEAYADVYRQLLNQSQP